MNFAIRNKIFIACSRIFKIYVRYFEDFPPPFVNGNPKRVAACPYNLCNYSFIHDKTGVAGKGSKLVKWNGRGSFANWLTVFLYYRREWLWSIRACILELIAKSSQPATITLHIAETPNWIFWSLDCFERKGCSSPVSEYAEQALRKPNSVNSRRCRIPPSAFMEKQ